MFKTPSFYLGNFEGPLELLLFLIQKEEMDLYEISLKALTSQIMELLEKEELDVSGDALSLLSTLLLMKSQKLIPQDFVFQEDSEEEKPLEMIQKLIEYCRFKDTAQILSLKEEEQHSFFTRAVPEFRKEWGTGLEEVQLEDLKKILLDAIAKSEKNITLIHQEPWQVETKIEWFHKELPAQVKMPFSTIFAETMPKEELICAFLALLELMKQQFLKVVRENEIIYITLYGART